MKHSNTSINFYGYISAVTATILWSGNFIVARSLIENIPPVSLAFWRWALAVAILFPFAIKPLIKDWPIIKNNIIYICITALLGISLFNTLIYIASHTTTAINLSLIAITFPIFIIILSRIFYNELLSLNKWIGVFLVASGVVILTTKGEISILKNIEFAQGDLWMLLAALTFAIYSLLLKKKPKNLGTRSFLLSTFLFGLIFLLPFYLWESATSNFQIFSVDSNTLFSIIYIGLFASLVSYVLWGKAVHTLGPTKSSMIYYTLPIFSGIAANLFLGEKIGLIHLLSMFLIIAGILTAIYEKKYPKHQ